MPDDVATLRAQLAEAQMMQKGSEYNEGCVMADLEMLQAEYDATKAKLATIEQIAQGLAEEVRLWGDDSPDAIRVVAQYDAYQQQKGKG
jgi:hypothetical protein